MLRTSLAFTGPYSRVSPSPPLPFGLRSAVKSSALKDVTFLEDFWSSFMTKTLERTTFVSTITMHSCVFAIVCTFESLAKQASYSPIAHSWILLTMATPQFGNDFRFASLSSLPAGRITGICVVDDSHFAFCNSTDGFVYVYNLHSGRETFKGGEKREEGAPQRVCSDGQRIYVSDEIRSEIRVYDAKTFALVAHWGALHAPGVTEIEKGLVHPI